jgi:lysophospholipase L1-like esterase
VTASRKTLRCALALGSVLVIPAAVFVDVLVAVRSGWQAIGVARAIAPLGGGLLVAGVLVAAWPAGRRFCATRFASFVIVGVALLAGVAVGELVARQFRITPLRELIHLRPPGTERVFRPTPDVMPGVEGESRFWINTHGIRGDELPVRRDATRILCVGGSTTECLYLDQSETWPQVLQELLRRETGQRLWVGNVGVSGYATPYHVRFARVSNLVAEMDCLVFLIGINDLLWSLAERDFSVVPLHGAPRPRPRLAETSLGKLALAAFQRLTSYGMEDATLIEDEVGENYVARRRARRGATAIRDVDLPLAAYVGYGRRVNELIDAWEERGVRGILVTHPVLWRAEMPPEEEALLWLGALPDGTFASAASLRRMMDRFNELVVRICTERGAECVDLGEMNGHAAFFYDDCHFNEAGAREVARRLAAHFKERGVAR